IRELNIECRLDSTLLPTQPVYDPTKTGNTRALVGVTNSFGSNVPANTLPKCFLSRSMTSSEIEEFKNGSKVLTVIGFIRYEGMLNYIYTKDFGVFWHRERKYFADINSETYNYDIATERPKGAPNLLAR